MPDSDSRDFELSQCVGPIRIWCCYSSGDHFKVGWYLIKVVAFDAKSNLTTRVVSFEARRLQFGMQGPCTVTLQDQEVPLGFGAWFGQNGTIRKFLIK